MSITASKYGGLAQQLISEGIVSEAHMKTAQTESQQQQIIWLTISWLMLIRSLRCYHKRLVILCLILMP